MSPASARPSLLPAPPKPHEWWRATLPTVPVTPDWERTIALIERLDDGVSLAVLRGRPDDELVLPSPGTRLFGIQIWLRGEPSIGFDHGPVCRPGPGALVLFHQPDHLASEVRLPAGQAIHIVDLRFSIDALRRITAFPVAERLRGQFPADFSVPEHGGLLVSCPASHGVLELARTISRSPMHHGAAAAVWRRSRGQEILAHVIDLLASGGASQLTPREHERVGRALALMDARHMEPWTAAALARAVGLSEKKLQVGVRERTGLAVHAHLRETRLRAAAGLLAEGRTVTEAALAVGYGNLSHFSKGFAQRFGMLPRDWRQAEGRATLPRRDPGR